MKPALPVLIAIAMLIAAVEVARPFGLGNLGKLGNLGSIGGKGKAIPQPTGKILLVDGTSFVLKVDAVSKVCRAGGC